MTNVPSPGEGYRWLEPGVDTLQCGDEVNDHSESNNWRENMAAIGATILQGDRFRFRRRIEPAPEPQGEWPYVCPVDGWYFTYEIESGKVHNGVKFKTKGHASRGYRYQLVCLTKPAPPVRKFEPIVIFSGDYAWAKVSVAGGRIVVEYQYTLLVHSILPAEWDRLKAACDKAAEFIKGSGND